MNYMSKTTLPDYVSFDILNGGTLPEILQKPTKKLTFPLSDEDKKDLEILEAKFDQEEGCSGLAGPQINISKAILVFSAPDNPDLKKFRNDFTQSMDKQIWINPSYTPIESAGKNDDYEACFSVDGIAGLVSRYKKIKYEAYDAEGILVKGEAEGFLARIIQHEIDHLNGVLFIELAYPDSVKPIEVYREERRRKIESAG